MINEETQTKLHIITLILAFFMLIGSIFLNNWDATWGWGVAFCGYLIIIGKDKIE